jgi:hypothetical protein
LIQGPRLSAGGRAVGGPIAVGLLAAFLAAGLLALAAAAVTTVLAAPDVAARRSFAPLPLLAVHLVALGFLPFAVTAASFHLLPVMLRNDIPQPGALRAALVVLPGGVLAACGVAYAQPNLLWPGAALVTVGLLFVVFELTGLVARAPHDRTLIVSRVGLLLSALGAVSALVLGGIAYGPGGDGRLILVHLHLALLGWLTMLIVTVGRTLGPMLALAPAVAPRPLPLVESSLGAGVALAVLGLAASSDATALAGGVVVLGALAAFARLMVRVARTRRIPLEAPLAHLLTGVAFLLQAAVLAGLMLTGILSAGRVVVAYVILLLGGWAAGVTLGHLGKLLSLSVWVSWPPGPRPKQDALYPRLVWLAEASAFAAAVELLAAGSLAGSLTLTRAGGVLLAVAAALAATGAAITWSRRPVPQLQSSHSTLKTGETECP